MTSAKTQAQSLVVWLRTNGDVDEETLEYTRRKIDAVVGRPGLPAVTGEARFTKATAHHADRPWVAAAALRAGARAVVAVSSRTGSTRSRSWGASCLLWRARTDRVWPGPGQRCPGRGRERRGLCLSPWCGAQEKR
jgi:hypothetical protein